MKHLTNNDIDQIVESHSEFVKHRGNTYRCICGYLLALELSPPKGLLRHVAELTSIKQAENIK